MLRELEWSLHQLDRPNDIEAGSLTGLFPNLPPGLRLRCLVQAGQIRLRVGPDGPAVNRIEVTAVAPAVQAVYIMLGQAHLQLQSLLDIVH